MKHLENGIAIHCPTQELDQKVREMLISRGYSWIGECEWDIEGPLTSIAEWSRCPGELVYANIGYYKRLGYTIIPASQFISDNTEEKPLRRLTEMTVDEFKRFYSPIDRLDISDIIEIVKRMVVSRSLHGSIFWYGHKDTYFLLEQAGFDVRFTLQNKTE